MGSESLDQKSAITLGAVAAAGLVALWYIAHPMQVDIPWDGETHGVDSDVWPSLSAEDKEKAYVAEYESETGNKPRIVYPDWENKLPSCKETGHGHIEIPNRFIPGHHCFACGIPL